MTVVAQAPKRLLAVAAAQMGPIQLNDSRESVLKRMIALLDQAAECGAKVVVFPELAFTTFFPRHLIPFEELGAYLEEESADGGVRNSPGVKPLLDRAKSLGLDVYVGYAEKAPQPDGSFRRYNSSIYYSAQTDKIIGKYRKVHLPGVTEPFKEPGATQQLEKRYFTNGDLGFPAFRAPGLVPGTAKAADTAEYAGNEGTGDPIFGMLICNDRRWAEGWRSYGLQGTEVVFCGYNTTAFAPQLLGSREDMSRDAAEAEVLFHHKLSCQGNSYMNALFSVNVGKCGVEDGNPLISGTIIVHPNGHIIAESKTKEDEIVFAQLDLADCRRGKEKTFAFHKHRRPDQYGMVVERTGVIEPALL
ncbi:carbon-nitrogen hydrolase [Thozetella sp. PMI_491]|nr:carbon-nitrogen hydrolase [Thozetella sp. PMI_491]